MGDLPVGREDVERAATVIRGRLHRTPMLSCRTLGPDAHLKAELLQKTGSFKPRGVLNKLASLTRAEKARGIVTWSAGNHAQAAAYASALEGLDCLVVMSRGANPAKVAATCEYGAEVDLQAANHEEAYERLLELIEKTGRTFVHPFDDPLVIAGQGTIGLEILEDVPRPDVVVVPVGGGGLISGIATAIKAERPGTRVIGAEPAGSNALSAALAADAVVWVESNTIADGLAPPFAGELPLRVCRERVDGIVLVTDDEIADAMRLLYTRAKLACEPAGAAAVAAILTGKVALESGPVVAVISGGNADPKVVAGILASR